MQNWKKANIKPAIKLTQELQNLAPKKIIKGKKKITNHFKPFPEAEIARRPSKVILSQHPLTPTQ